MVLYCLNIVVTRFNQHSVAWDCVNQQIAVFIFGSPVSLFCMYPVFCVFWILRNVNFCVFRSFKGLPFSTLLDIEWKLCAQTTSDVQTSQRTQCYTILACCWYHWCEYCRFVIFQLFFLKFDEL